MTAVAVSPPRHEGMRLNGRVVRTDQSIEVHYPYTDEVVGSVPRATAEHARTAVAAAAGFRPLLTRHERYTILMRVRAAIGADADRWASLITLESGLCLKDTRYEAERACDVLLFAANQALVDDGQVFSCDLTEHGQARRIYTSREPLLGVIGAITPFNHPLNQVVHKVAPAVATNNRLVLKPSEKTPLTALAFADALYEAGLPSQMLQVITGYPAEIGDVLVTDPSVDLVSFTGSAETGRRLARRCGYRRLVLELGGSDPLIVLDDADPAAAARLTALGSYRNSGQRCTAVKRILVQDGVAEPFVAALLAETRALRCANPLDPATDVGTLIDRAAANRVARAVEQATGAGATLLCGGAADGAQYPPTVLDHVTPDMAVAVVEVFGPVSPVIRFRELDEAVRIANSSRYALSAGVLTSRLDRITRLVRELHAGSVNIWEVPGYRLECTPFGGIKDSGLGIKEGVIEAMRNFTNVKTYSLPW
jgi:phosphonoacetaldehyde dehydrogenase